MRPSVLLFMTTLLAAGSTPEWQQHYSAAEQFMASGDCPHATAELELALAAAEPAGPADAALPETLVSLAAIDVWFGRYRLAEGRYRRALAIYEQYHPELETGLAIALQGFAELCTAERQWSRAEPLYSRAHDLLVRNLGPNHRSVGRVLVSMGELAQELRQFSKAEKLYMDAMAILRDPSRHTDLDVADLEQNLAMLYLETGRPENSGELFREAIDEYRRTYPLHPNLAVILRNYARFEADHRNFPEAENSFRSALQICETSLGPDNLETGVVLDSYSKFLTKIKRRKEAKALAGRSQAILSKSLGNSHARDVVDWRSLLAR